MNLKIKGMHCNACKQLIELELEENGFGNVKVNKETEELVIPEKLEDKIDEIKDTVNEMEGYEIIA